MVCLVFLAFKKLFLTSGVCWVGLPRPLSSQIRMKTRIFIGADQSDHFLVNAEFLRCILTKISLDSDHVNEREKYWPDFLRCYQTRIYKNNKMQTKLLCDEDHADQNCLLQTTQTNFKRCRPEFLRCRPHNSKIMQTKFLFVADHADQLLKLQTRISKMQTNISCNAGHADQLLRPQVI